jgi:rubrerythrin
MGSKLCRKCLCEKPLTEFYRHSQMGDGHLNKCKECTRADVTENRNSNAEYYRQYDRFRYDHGRKPASNDNHLESSRRWYERNRMKKRAEGMVFRALKSGKLSRPSCCEQCGDDGHKIEAHHENYSKPLDVKWLCTKCHGATRKKPRTLAAPIGHHGGHYSPMSPTRAATGT